MYRMNLRFLATVFVDAQSFTPTARIMSRIGDAIGDQYVPASVIEQTPTGPQNRIGFTSADAAWSIVLATNRLDLTKAPIDPEGANMGTFEGFCEIASELLPSIMGQIGRTGSRLACVQEGLLASEYQEQTNGIADRLLHFPASFRQNEVMEWNWRGVSQIDREFGVTEETNTIASVYRAYFDFGPLALAGLQQRMNGIRMDIDINTLATNTDQRFDQANIAQFFIEAPNWHSELIADIRQLVEGGNEGRE